jgi:hypothetical protein
MFPPDHVLAVPPSVTARVVITLIPVPEIVAPPFRAVPPAPAIVPPVHVDAPVAVNVAVPPSVPPDIVKAPLLAATLKFTVPLVTSVTPATAYEPATFAVPVMNRTVPAPPTVEPAFRLCAPPNSSTPPLAVNDPVLVPPPARLSVPVWTFTDPVLLKTTPLLTVVVLEAAFAMRLEASAGRSFRQGLLASHLAEAGLQQAIREMASRAPIQAVDRDGTLIMVDDDRMPLRDGEVPQQRMVRFRTLGCYPLSGAIESEAATLPEIIQEMLLTKHSERQGRLIDYDGAASMEQKKREGYF